jgi:DNA-directed RNA polymerase subunit RPC12/RpoP
LYAKTNSPNREEQTSMPTVSLKVTHLPSGAADHPTPELGKPLFRGTGDTDYLCGNCGSVIAASMGPTQRVIVDATTCATCGAENEFPRHLRA